MQLKVIGAFLKRDKYGEHSKKTVEYATCFAVRYHAPVRLLHVFQIPDYTVTQYEYRQQGRAQLKNQVDIAEEDARENLEAFDIVS
jgi:t-SNARE complex subunit (syntaxin)